MHSAASAVMCCVKLKVNCKLFVSCVHWSTEWEVWGFIILVAASAVNFTCVVVSSSSTCRKLYSVEHCNTNYYIYKMF